MPEGNIIRHEGTKCPMAALLPKVILNYFRTVEDYVFASLRERQKKNCERTRKIVKEPGKKRKTMQMISIFIHAF